MVTDRPAEPGAEGARIVLNRDEFVQVGGTGETCERWRGILAIANANWPSADAASVQVGGKKFAWRDQFPTALVGEALVPSDWLSVPRIFSALLAVGSPRTGLQLAGQDRR